MSDTLTAAQAARQYKISLRTVQDNLLRGRLRGCQIPGSGVWLIDRADFEEWIAERGDDPTSADKPLTPADVAARARLRAQGFKTTKQER